MEAVASQHTSNTDRQPRTTRELVAGATLVAVGALGVFLPFLSGALLVSIVGTNATGLEAIGLAGQVVTYIPLICIVALAAAIGLYRHASWGRAAALTVGALLAASPVAQVVGSGASGSGVVSVVHLGTTEDSPIPLIVGVLLHHVFATQASAPTYVSLVVAATGAVVLAALWRGARPIGAPAPGPAAPVRRPSTAMLLLLVTGILSIGPYVSWLLAAAIPRTAVASGGSALDSGTGSAVAIGLLYAIPGAMGSISALAAARAIHARASYGPWIAPAASLIAGGWSALWITLLAAVMSVSGEGAGIVVGLFLFAVALVCAASFFVVTASVYRRRSWFTGSTAATSWGRRGPGRFWTVSGGIGAALAIPLALSLATGIGRPELPHVDFGAVLFDGVQYHSAGPVNVPDDRLSVAGDLEAWDASLGIDDPTVFTLDALPAALVIGLYDRQGLGDASLAAYVPLSSVDDLGSFLVPEELCQYVDLEAPGVSVQPCGPPRFVRFRGLDYEDVGWAGFEVTAADITATNETVVPSAAPDPRVDLTVHTIHDVTIDEAFALRVGSRVVVYQAGYYSAELCRYSPAALSDPLQLDYLPVPPGCEFPYVARYGQRTYVVDFRTRELYDIPESAVAPIGAAVATDRSGEGEFGPSDDRPFPATLDDTVYRITGVDPAIAIAFAVLDRFVVLRSSGEGLPVPAELCPYVRVDVVERYIADGETDIGCEWGSR